MAGWCLINGVPLYFYYNRGILSLILGGGGGGAVIFKTLTLTA